MAVIPLSGQRREGLGKGGARKARAAGHIPAVLYGHGEEPIPVSVGARDFDLALRGHRGGNPIVNLAVAGGEYTAIIRDVQYDPISHAILHLDFQHISLTETIEVNVNVHLVGLPTGVKDGGGILEQILRGIEVRTLPTAIPPSIDIDVSALNIGDSVHVRDLAVPPGVVVLTDPETTLATVVPPTVMEEKPVEEVAAAATVEGAEPEVIAKGKKTEEGEAEAKGGEKAAEKEKDKEKDKDRDKDRDRDRDRDKGKK